MNRLPNSRHRGLAAALAALACAAAWPAHATLGELQAAAPAGNTAMQLKAATAQSPAYSVSTSTADNGTVIKEYAAPGGKVFAVIWRGPMAPDLGTLFGSYYTDYQTALAARQAAPRTRHLQLDSGRMIYQVGGHMGDLRGSAWVPALVPQGLSLGDLR